MVTYKQAEQVAVADLRPYEKNAKMHDQTQVQNIAKSIEKFGFTQPLVIDDAGIVIIGHGRLEAAKLLGLETVPCIKRDDLTEEQVKELRILDNKLNESDWNTELLAAEIKGLDFDGFNLDFEIPEELEPIVAEEDDWEPEFQPDPQIQTGEVWALGNHRLLCGDSTVLQNVKKLMGGATADLLLTDPPYNVSLGMDPHGWTEKSSIMKARRRRTDGKIIENDSWSDDDDFIDFLRKAFTASTHVLKPGGAFYIWYASTQSANFLEAAKKSNMTVREILVWVKNTFSLGRQDYQWRHEPCLYGWKDGAGHYFAETRKESTVIEDIIDPEKMTKKQLQDYVRIVLDEEQTQTTVLHEDRPTRSDLHPTMKPIKLMARLIRNSTKEGETVLDPFGGSGSTLIACEQMKRRCFTIELDRTYAQTIIDRWEQFTGEKAVRL